METVWIVIPSRQKERPREDSGHLRPLYNKGTREIFDTSIEQRLRLSKV